MIEDQNNLITKILSGNPSQEESRMHEDLLQASSEYMTQYNHQLKIWLGAKDVAIIESLDVTEEYKKFRTNIDVTTERRIKKKTILLLSLIALIILLVVGIFYFKTGAAQQDNNHYLLADGSQVWLKDENSRLDLDQFTATNRLLDFDGTAYFEIARDETAPFQIAVKGKIINVLGTSFQISNKEGQVSVTVNSGKVKFYAETTPLNAVILLPGDRGISDTLDRISTTRIIDPNYLSWYTGEYYFDNTPLTKVINILSERYENIKLDKQLKQACNLNATFKNESVKHMLRVIEETCDVKAVRKNGFITLTEIK